MRLLITIFLTALILGACSQNEETNGKGQNEESKEESYENSYNGKHLKIGVIGEKIKDDFENVTFQSVEPSILKNKEKKYDAFFITEEFFKELSKDNWTETFKNISIPVFFINLDKQSFIFRVDDMDYNENSPDATENTKGFVRTKKEGMDVIKGWGYGNPTKSTDPSETPKWIFYHIFKDVEEFKENNR